MSQGELEAHVFAQLGNALADERIDASDMDLAERIQAIRAAYQDRIQDDIGPDLMQTGSIRVFKDDQDARWTYQLQGVRASRLIVFWYPGRRAISVH